MLVWGSYSAHCQALCSSFPLPIILCDWEWVFCLCKWGCLSVCVLVDAVLTVALVSVVDGAGLFPALVWPRQW